MDTEALGGRRARDYEWDGENFVETTLGGDPRFYGILTELSDLYSKKNTDYAGGGIHGPMGNFIRVSEILKLYPHVDWSSPTGVAIIYKLKQLDGGIMMLQQGKESVTGEGFRERMIDDAVYSLLAILLHEDA